MSIYNKNGSEILSAYSTDGTDLQNIYDIYGNIPNEDYNIWDTEYQHNILLTRDQWKNEYRSDSNIIPLLLATDEHQNFDSEHKPTFDYLSLAIRWDEVSALLNLGDVCGAIYTTSTLNKMQSCLSSIQGNKQIHVLGNHDVWATKTDGSSYAYSITDQWDTLTNTYFNNSNWIHHIKYDNRGNQCIYDDLKKVKYCLFSTWYFDTTGGEINQPYYKMRLTGDCCQYFISMLSQQSDYDIIILSHVQPLHNSYNWISPPVDEQQQSTKYEARTGTGCIGYQLGLDQMITDRKTKVSGQIVDCNGVSHSYDFSHCKSDLLCCLAGHDHKDSYTICNGVPVIVFDAYRYDNQPLFMVNINKTQKHINIWKFDESNKTYKYQVNF